MSQIVLPPREFENENAPFPSPLTSSELAAFYTGSGIPYDHTVESLSHECPITRFETEANLQSELLADHIGLAEYERRIDVLVREHPERLIDHEAARKAAQEATGYEYAIAHMIFAIMCMLSAVILVVTEVFTMHNSSPAVLVIAGVLFGCPAFLRRKAPAEWDRTTSAGA